MSEEAKNEVEEVEIDLPEQEAPSKVNLLKRKIDKRLSQIHKTLNSLPPSSRKTNLKTTARTSKSGLKS